MKTARILTLVFTVVVTGQAIAQQQDVSKIEIKTTPVAGNIYMLEGPGGNITVSAGPDGVLMVDAQSFQVADKIKAAIAKLNPGKIKFLINTHYHQDHTGGNRAFGPETIIIAQTNVRKRLMSEQHVKGRSIPPTPKEGLPVVTFDDSLSIHFNGEEIKVVHPPGGHTDGDGIIWFTGSKVVAMGDEYFAGRFPFVDLDAGGDVEVLERNIKDVLAKLPAGAKLVPGHGPLSTAEDLKTYDRLLTTSLELVKKAIKAGKSLDQIKKEGMPAEWKSYDWGFVPAADWLEIVYNSVSKKK